MSCVLISAAAISCAHAGGATSVDRRPQSLDAVDATFTGCRELGGDHVSIRCGDLGLTLAIEPMYAAPGKSRAYREAFTLAVNVRMLDDAYSCPQGGCPQPSKPQFKVESFPSELGLGENAVSATWRKSEGATMDMRAIFAAMPEPGQEDKLRVASCFLEATGEMLWDNCRVKVRSLLRDGDPLSRGSSSHAASPSSSDPLSRCTARRSDADDVSLSCEGFEVIYDESAPENPPDKPLVDRLWKVVGSIVRGMRDGWAGCPAGGCDPPLSAEAYRGETFPLALDTGESVFSLDWRRARGAALDLRGFASVAVDPARAGRGRVVLCFSRSAGPELWDACHPVMESLLAHGFRSK
jgi:hypothetical protein